MPGSGKSTIAKKLASKLGLKRYSAGDYRRNQANKMGLTIGQFNKLGEKEDWTDKEVDNWQAELGKKEDNFVIDGRTGFYFIPNSIKILLIVSPEKGAKRIRKGDRPEEQAQSEKEMIKLWKERFHSDVKRYKNYYNLDIYNKQNYDFVLDTTNLSKEEVFDKVVGFIESKS